MQQLLIGYFCAVDTRHIWPFKIQVCRNTLDNSLNLGWVKRLGMNDGIVGRQNTYNAILSKMTPSLINLEVS
jgi:hypothetical protein